jgi:hypothetical protein
LGNVITGYEGSSANGGAAVVLALIGLVDSIFIIQRHFQARRQTGDALQQHFNELDVNPRLGILKIFREIKSEGFFVVFASRCWRQHLRTNGRNIRVFTTLDVWLTLGALGINQITSHQKKG